MLWISLAYGVDVDGTRRDCKRWREMGFFGLCGFGSLIYLSVLQLPLSPSISVCLSISIRRIYILY